MSKLKEKLQELGYKVSIFQNRYVKNYEETGNYILIQLSKYEDEIKYWGLYCPNGFSIQEHIDSLQKEFNQMQKDLAILKEIEKDELEL